MMLCIYFWKFSTFVWVKIIQKQQKYPKKKFVNFVRGRRTLLWNTKYMLNACSEGNILSRMPNMQVLCPCIKTPHKSNVALTDV